MTIEQLKKQRHEVLTAYENETFIRKLLNRPTQVAELRLKKELAKIDKQIQRLEYLIEY